MKKIMSIVALATVVFQSQGQGTTHKSDSTFMKMDSSTVFVVENDTLRKNFCCNEKDCLVNKKVTLSISHGINGYLNSSQNLRLQPESRLMELDYERSKAFEINVMVEAVNIKDWFYISSGLGVLWNNYHFAHNTKIVPGSNSAQFKESTGAKPDKNKLRTTYLQIPVMAGVRFGNNKHPWGIQIGAIGALRTGSSYIQKYRSEGERVKIKQKNNFGLNPWRLDTVFRISKGNVGIFGRCSHTALFNKKREPKLYSFSAGITIGGFTF